MSLFKAGRKAPITPLTRSMRVQLLDPPHNNGPDPFAEVGIGLSHNAMELCRSIWKFRYMGNARFEDGSIQKALAKIVGESDHYRGWTLEFEGETIYVISMEQDRAEIIERIEAWATTEDTEYPFSQPHRTSEQVLLWQALQDPPQTKACGWLELDNGFMFFTDRTMFERTTTAFSVPVLVEN